MDADVTDSAGTPADPGPDPDPDPGHRGDGGAGPQDDGSPDGGREGGGPENGGPENGGGRGSGGGPGTWAERTGAGRPDGRKRHWLRWTALGAALVVLVAAGVGWWLYQRLNGNIRTDTAAEAELRAYERERPTALVTDAQNILLIGSDSRAGDNRKYGRDDGGQQRSDTVILLHLAADRKSATAVSVPRDLMVEIPGCHGSGGKATGARTAQFNWAFEIGGTACTVRTVELMTKIRVDHHVVVDFSGFKDMVDAVDGVGICLREPIDDPAAHLKLSAGQHTLDGEQALGYVRARKSLGDGSDTARMDRQQQFLAALVNKVRSNGVLLNPARLYPVLDAATKSLTTDEGLDSLRDLYGLVRGMRNVPTDKVQFLTVPRRPYRQNANRDELVQPDADRLFRQLREDAPVTVVPAKNSGSGPAPEKRTDAVRATPNPTYSGTNAADDLCKE
ncbi:LCP family protein [Streptomyces sp. NBC_00102]|uniref:LCP family protein n=1 Tax=Streptomyces sp. NBC_00102 TaxID=2975652 RepID=UPI00224E4A14|nr:LCP family protein [Streptomyces sp. NBC_00102]MCX5397416.1 LCP family protein [Streptomyces sp. NBC_00102]